MECIQHFSHDHPLSLFQLDDDENPKPYKCRICGLPILSSPSYTCSIDTKCNFFLHKACTQLPRELYYDGHLDTLNLELAPGNNPSRHNFTYRCTNYSECGFELHPLVAKPVEIKSKHRSHLKHPLVACCRESLVSLCDACGEEQKGFFFNCQECNFWIHQDCAILPTILKLSIYPHPFILTYNPPFNIISKLVACDICSGTWRLRFNGIYFCGLTIKAVHVACAKSKMENLQTETIQEFVQLPDEGDTFPSLVIRRSADDNGDVKKVLHKHPLILEDGNRSSSSREAAYGDLVCDVCIQPLDISSPFYRCQSNGCHFLAHNICANKLHTRVKYFRLQEHMIRVLSNSTTDFFNSVFLCTVCYRPSNGFVYQIFDKYEEETRVYQDFSEDEEEPREPRVYQAFSEDEEGPRVYQTSSEDEEEPRVYQAFSEDIEEPGVYQTFSEDEEEPWWVRRNFCNVECAYAPLSINHASHGQHPMFQLPPFQETSNTLRCCSAESFIFDIYTCVLCDFNIHIRCALLPKRTRHKFDEHPLELIMTHHHNNEDKQQELFCEVCEQDIELKYWYYGCHKCEYYFHINCIPSVGYFSKVKFGKTFSDDKVHPQHPLTLTRMLTHQTHERCSICKKIIKGFSDDDMAFHCSPCHFWVHFSCAAATTGSRTYSHYLNGYKQHARKIKDKLKIN